MPWVSKELEQSERLLRNCWYSLSECRRACHDLKSMIEADRTQMRQLSEAVQRLRQELRKGKPRE